MAKVTLEPKVHPSASIENAQFGRYVVIAEGSRVAHSSLGDYSYCDRFCDIANARIGKFSNIASFVRIGPTDHPMEKASLHHFLYRSAGYWDDAEDDVAFFTRRRSRLAHIGHDTWLGHNAIVPPEITVGDGAVVAAGAVVTKDVAPYTVVGGIPARVIRRRHSEDVAERLTALAWWDWSHERLRATLDDFRALETEAFLDKHGG